jgi:hypothetical protein
MEYCVERRADLCEGLYLCIREEFEHTAATIAYLSIRRDPYLAELKKPSPCHDSAAGAPFIPLEAKPSGGSGDAFPFFISDT